MTKRQFIDFVDFFDLWSDHTQATKLVIGHNA